MDTAHLKAFLRIAETGSISRAAESLGIAQPSLSQQLLRLEDEIGFAVFTRTARGVTLTEAGRVFREHARQILHASEQAVADARQLRDEARGQVVLAMPPSLARLVGARLVAAAIAQAPMVRVRVVEAFSGSIRGWLEAEKIDLGVLYDATLRHFTLRPIVSEPLALAGPPGRFAQGAQVALAELAGERLIAPGPQHGLRQLLDREAGRAGVELHFDQDIDSIDTMLELTARGLGIAVLPSCAVEAAAQRGAISVATLGQVQRILVLARNPSHVLTHASVRVESLLLQVLADCSAEGAWQGRVIAH